MKELIDPRAVEKALLFAAVIGPLAGVILGVVIGAHERRTWPKVVAGMLIGALGTVVYGMWRVYGLVTDALGLDSVLNLCVQLAMFAAFGIVLGFVMFAIRKLIKGSGAQG